LLVGLTVGALGLLGCPTKTRPIRHVLFVTVDTLRADRLGCYGHARDTSPGVDRLAAGGIRFQRAIAQWPKTGPSFGSLFSGRYAQSTGMTHKAALRLSEETQTLAESLRADGFATAAVVSNPVLPARLGWSQGFDRYVETWADDPGATDDPYRLRDWTNARRVNELALPMLRELAMRRDERSFLWVHYTDPHAPYTLQPGETNPFLDDALARGDRGGDAAEEARPESWQAREIDGRRDLSFYLAQYDANVRYVDRHVDALVREAERLGLLEDGLVVFTSDHGESLGEHGFYFEHGREPYNSTSWVPLVVYAPGRLAPGVVESPVELLDLYPTLASLLEIRALATGLEGQDLAPSLRGKREPPAPHYAFSEAGGALNAARTHFRSVQDGRWKLIFQPPGGPPGARENRRWPPRWQFFDLAADPGENLDLVERRGNEFNRLRGALQGWMRELTAEAPDDQSAETLRALRALGYVQ
jgi:arylsulfatase A-like enzyme